MKSKKKYGLFDNSGPKLAQALELLREAQSAIIALQCLACIAMNGEEPISGQATLKKIEAFLGR